MAIIAWQGRLGALAWSASWGLRPATTRVVFGPEWAYSADRKVDHNPIRPHHNQKLGF